MEPCLLMQAMCTAIKRLDGCAHCAAASATMAWRCAWAQCPLAACPARWVAASKAVLLTRPLFIDYAADSVYGEMHRAGKDAMLKLMEAEREGEQVGSHEGWGTLV